MEKKLISIIALLAFTLFVVGCKKEENINLLHPNGLENVEKPKVYSETNPFDKNHEYIKEVMQDVADLISDLKEEDCSDFGVFIEKFGTVMKKHKNSPYPQLNFVNSSSNYRNLTPEQRELIDLTSNFISDIETIGLVEASLEAERTIALVQDEVLQEDMYNVVSQLKFSYYYAWEGLSIEEIFLSNPDLAPNWDDRFRYCMNAKWDSMNWIEKTGFIAGLPESALWQMASCAWEASQGSGGNGH